MKYTKAKLALVALAASSALPASQANASDSNPGYVKYITVLPGGQALFTTTGSRQQPPACATSVGRWAFDATTPAGQSKLALLMAIYNKGKQITVFGRGTCDTWGDTETTDYFYAFD